MNCFLGDIRVYKQKMFGYREKEGGRYFRYFIFTYMWEVRNSLDCVGQFIEFGIVGDRVKDMKKQEVKMGSRYVFRLREEKLLKKFLRKVVIWISLLFKQIIWFYEGQIGKYLDEDRVINQKYFK